jgi:hypothetical protein
MVRTARGTGGAKKNEYGRLRCLVKIKRKKVEIQRETDERDSETNGEERAIRTSIEVDTKGGERNQSKKSK